MNSELFAILGSGFGLYGYLPALVQGCGWQVVLPERYRDRLSARTELDRFSAGVHWVDTEDESLRLATGAVIALRPVDQERWIEKCVDLPAVRRLLLEKPLARTPLLAHRALETLIRSNKEFRIGYLFGATAWGNDVRKLLGAGRERGTLSIRWQFCAHHYQHDLTTWKRDTEAGGGAIRFFGIHLIALLAAAGYSGFASSRTFGSGNDLEAWHAVATGPGVPECEIVVETRSPTTAFEVMYRAASTGSPELHRRLAGPFEADQAGDEQDQLDLRIRHLTELCRSLSEPSGPYNDWYRRTLELWREAEGKARFTPRPRS